MQKTNRKNSAVKIGLAAASALALTLGGVSTAYAADINVGPDQVAGFEVGGNGKEDGFNYDQWHIGSNYDADYPLENSVTFGECSVTTLAHPNAGSVVQVLKGFPVAERPTTSNGSAAALEAVVNSTSVTVLEGNVTLQLPIFILDENGEVDYFTTLRTGALAAGTYGFGDLEIEESNPSQGIVEPGDTVASLLAFFAEISAESAYEVQILGVGFTGSEGAVVESLSFSGDTYYFGTGDCAPAAPTPNPTAPTPPKEVQTAAA